MGAGGALTGGLKELPPVGTMPFSVGVTPGVEVGVGVVLDGLSVSLPPQAVKAAIDTKAATPSAAVVLQNRELRIWYPICVECEEGSRRNCTRRYIDPVVFAYTRR